jgi:hypothetical protein
MICIVMLKYALMRNYNTPPRPEELGIDTWFPMFDGLPVNEHGLLRRNVLLRVDPLDVAWDSPLATSGLPIILESSQNKSMGVERISEVVSTTTIPDRIKYAGHWSNAEFPLDPGMGYRVDKDDLTVAARLQKRAHRITSLAAQGWPDFPMDLRTMSTYVDTISQLLLS